MIGRCHKEFAQNFQENFTRRMLRFLIDVVVCSIRPLHLGAYIDCAKTVVVGNHFKIKYFI